MTKTIARDIMAPMIRKSNAIDRLVLELYTTEFKHKLNVYAITNKVPMRTVMLMALAQHVPELKHEIELELLGRPRTLAEVLTGTDPTPRD